MNETIRSQLGHGVRRLRRATLFWSALLVTLASGIAIGTSVLPMAAGGLSHPFPVTSPGGLALPAEAVAAPTPDAADAAAPAPLWSGELPWSTRDGAQRTIAETQRDGARVLLWSLGGSAALLLLVACANLSLLLGARAGARRHEVAVRHALGATSAALARHLLLRNLPFLAVGTLVGSALGALALTGLQASWPSGLAHWLEEGRDPGVIAIALALPLLTAALFSVVPATLVGRREIMSSLATGGRATADVLESRARERTTRLAIASAVTLMVGAGLLLRSLGAVPLTGAIGFNAADTLTFSVTPIADAPGAADRAMAYAGLLEAASETEGFRAAAIASEGSWLGLGNVDLVHVLTDIPIRPALVQPAQYHSVGPGYFEALGIPLVAGRGLEAGDAAGSRPVAVVSQTFANRLVPDGRPVGKQLQLGTASLDAPWFTVVGVVGDVRPPGVGQTSEPQPAIYLSALQIPPGTAALAVRVDGALDSRLPALLVTLQDASGPGWAVAATGSMEEVLAGFRQPLSWFGRLIGLVALLVAPLAAFALYALVSHNVSRRAREIGVRLALGAAPARVVRMIVGEGLRLTGGGLVLGMAGALCLGRLLQFNFEAVSAFDPAVNLAAASLVLAISAAASYLPARAASRLDPAVVLREE